MEFKGTKDWKIVKLKATRFYRERIEIQFGNDGQCVAEFVHNGYDAKLIEAAPKLLAAAIKAIEECCDLIGTDAGNSLEKAINEALN
jgi:hypothetical protein